MNGAERTWFIAGGLVLDPAGGEPRRRDMVVHDGAIIAVLEPGTASTAAGAGLPRYDAADTLIVPGLVNAHTHGHANLMKGVADRWPLEVSLAHGPWMSGARDLETIYLSTLLGAVEMLAGGITSCYDLVYEFPRPTAAGVRAVAQAYADAGMRAIVAPLIADRSFFEAYPDCTDTFPEALAERIRAFALAPFDETIAELEALVAGDAFPAGTRLGIAPTIPLHCSDAFLAACRGLAARASLPMHMHLAESRVQATAGRRTYGRSLTAHLAAAGLLGPGFTAAHGVWLDDADLDLLAASGATIAHVPASNYRLGSGTARVRPMLDRGINVALATDGANSSDALDMFLAMRLASFASRSFGEGHERWLSSDEVVRAATIGGAEALGLAGHIGRPAAGFAADLVFLDLADPAFVPLNDPLNQLVNCAASRAVRDVMVDGRFVVRNGTVPAWTSDLRSRLRECRERLRAGVAPSYDLALSIEPFVARYVADRASDPLPALA